MKTKLFLFITIFSFIFANSQTTVEIHPGDDVNQIFDNELNGIPPIGDLIFDFYSGTYNVYSIDVHAIGMAKNATNRIIIKSHTNNADSVIVQSNDDNVFHINTSFVTLQNLTIISTSSANTQRCLWLQEDGQSGSLDSIIIENNIFISDTSNGDKCINYEGSTANINNIHIRNNTINNGDIGIELFFSDVAVNVEIVNNIFRNQKVTNIDVSNAKNLKIINNDIKMPNTGDTYNNTSRGISLNSIIGNSDATDSLTLIKNNRIYTNINNNCKYVGIDISSSYAINSGRIIFYNNFIDIENSDLSIIGFYNSSSENIEFYNNTIKLVGPISKGILYDFGGAKTIYVFDFKNNLIYSENIVFESVFEIYPGDVDFNNNCYFTNNTSEAFNIEGTPYDFSHWKTTTSVDNFSVFDNPQFIGFNNPTPHNPMISNLAPTLPDVSIDINGLVRNMPNSDFGAKEVAFVNLGNDTSICFGSSIILDAGPAFDYIWNTGAITQTISADSSGQYIVTITEINGGASATDTINVNLLPEISISFNSQEPNCYTSTDGYIVANTVNATTPIDYNWAGSFDGDGTDSLYNLGMGSYYLTITDANLCTAESYSFINAPTQLSLSFDTIEFCGGCIGELTANPVGGTGSYNYSWSTGSIDSHIMDLCTGTYTLTLTDDNNCTLIDSIDITEGPLGYLAGTIDYSGGLFNANEIKVELYKQYIENAFHVEKVDENMIDGTSKFEFTGVYPYQYTFRGIVEQGNYNNVVTSYYGNTVDWFNATYVNIGCGDTINDIVFSMYEVASLNGTGTFSGTITYQSSNKSLNTTGEPVTGAEIYVAQDPNDEPVANTLSDTNGDWSVDSIQVGTGYKLRVDIPGLEQITTYEDLYITPNDTVQTNLNFIVDTASGGGIMTDTTITSIATQNQTIEVKVFPNPTTQYVSFETYLAKEANIKFDIININGETVYTSNEIDGFTGNYKIKIDMSNYSNGTYLLKFKIDNNYYLKKIIKQ